MDEVCKIQKEPDKMEYLCPCCPHPNIEECPHIYSVGVLKRLCALVSDFEGADLCNRQFALMNHYLGLCGGTVKLRELKYFTTVLEFLCENLSSVPEYQTSLWCFLRLCQKPPVQLKPIDSADQNVTDVIAHHFTGLGNCLLVVENPSIQILIVDVLHNLLGPRGKTEISYEATIAGLSRSQLSQKMMKWLIFVPDELYLYALEIALRISVVSEECGTQNEETSGKCVVVALQFLQNNCVHWLLKRLSLVPSVTSNFPDAVTELSTGIMWRAMSSLGNEKREEPPEYQDEIMESFRIWLRREVTIGKPSVRNDVATLLCRFLYIYPNTNVLKSGILHDICLLAFATEFDISGSWAGQVKFPPSPENLEFKKILFLTITYMFNMSGVRLICKTYGTLPAMAQYLNPESGKTETALWPPLYRYELVGYTLHALPIIAGYFPHKYIASGATEKILELINTFAYDQKNMELVKCSLHCLYNLLLKGICLNHFRQMDVPRVLLSLCHHILQYPLSLKAQLILTYAFLILSAVCSDIGPMLSSYELAANLSMEVFMRLCKPSEFDSKTDGGLVITAIDFVWNAVVKIDEVRNLFIKKGGVFAVLDLMRVNELPAQVLLAGVLADLTLTEAGVPQAVTWRGQSEQETVLALLCSVWRKQEAVKCVQRNANGCIYDVEAVLEGKAQLQLPNSLNVCAPVSEMVGCARPKIYAVYTNLLHRHYNLSDGSKRTYGVDFLNISNKDKVTLEIIAHYEYLKRGEIWKGLLNGFRELKITLLPQVEHVLYIMQQKNLAAATNVALKQKEYCALDAKQEMNKESALYESLRSSILVGAIEGLQSMKAELFSCDLNFTQKIKKDVKKKLEKRRRQLAIKLDSTYHESILLGTNFVGGGPDQNKVRKSSKLLQPTEYWTKELSMISVHSGSAAPSEPASINHETFMRHLHSSVNSLP